MRRIALEYLEHACIGQTTEIDGVTLPYRPVAVTLAYAFTFEVRNGRARVGASRH